MVDSAISNQQWIVAHVSLTLTIAGTVFNLLTFTILCQSTFRNAKTRPTLHYMRTIAIFDIFMLYGWNLDHFFSTVYGFEIQTSTMPLCRFLSFLNYFAAQTSAWLRVFICWDRYLSLSRLHKTWFSHSNNVLTVIACIIVCCAIINGQFFIFGCSFNADGSINAYSTAFQTYPTWDYLNLALYNCAPFILMVIFNSGVIYYLIHLRRTSTVQNSRIQHRSISITLVITTFLFLIMTIPSTVGFAFFSNTAGDTILYFLDGLLYSYHTLSFPLYIITFDEFRREVFGIITCNRNKRRVVPQTQTGVALHTIDATKVMAIA
ncbi:unnamed protein product [Rotaria socialis]|uniref:G-protein coupled receptors family 1 profile domain-containing protein n=1 Tax=Rotaria socialis TaxID=392032 RepID=A0A818WW39_9BILA|nr:unnamed protein product [Rotaria socialis]CAF3481936.1 unnamed protein product [Rotaria socialis]CAF3731187.1 unnamed protein product [Rotaria socialis]CAF4418235.1 unnamed protein product [Rotaria socialis]CAF4556378.1 unnamed protein product [Rotaria socialis]